MTPEALAITTGRAEATIAELERIAVDIKRSIGSRKRPLVVEFSGIPKAGKTTSAQSLALFLRRNGFSTRTVTERASVCPVRNKQHPHFNIWTGCASLAQILEYIESPEPQVLIVDRGVFDVLVWLRLLFHRGLMSREELRVSEEFFLLDRWCRSIDLVIQIRTSPESAMEREFSTLLTRKTGSIMNYEMLSDYLLAADQVTDEHGARFRKIIQVDTEEKPTIVGVEEITREVLTALRFLSDEELVVLPQSIARRRLSTTAFDGGPHRLRTLDSLLKSDAGVMRRLEAEQDVGHLQLIACAVVSFRGKLLVFTKLEIDPHSRMHGTSGVWVGGHLRAEDLENHERKPRDGLVACLRRELQEELSLSVDVEPKFLGLAYDQTHPKSVMHLGVVFQIELPDEKAAAAFSRGRTLREFAGQELIVDWVALDDMEAEVATLEPWSRHILRGHFGIAVKDTKKYEQLWLV